MPATPAAELPRQLDRLERLYGAPEPVLPRGALDWVLWENAAYLVAPERRKEAYRALKKLAGRSGAGLLRVPRAQLLALAAGGGMLPEQRVEKWLDIAGTLANDFDGDLEAVLALPLAKARAATTARCTRPAPRPSDARQRTRPRSSRKSARSSALRRLPAAERCTRSTNSPARRASSTAARS